MLIKILLLSMLYLSQSILTDKNELKRQYENYADIFNKQKSSEGFENFVQNLGIIEHYNQNNSKCKMHLTQYSDTADNNSIYNSCDK